MEKLIKLLNEYSKLKEERYLGEEGKPIRTRKEYELEYPIERIRIISKPYGFVQRLINNNKIDLLHLTIRNLRYTDILVSHFSWEERIIMILSIQDNPIDFLIDCLK